MKLAPIISLGLSVILGAAALFIWRGDIFGSREAEATSVPPPRVVAEPEMVEILVALEDMDMAAPVLPELVVAKKWPADAVPVDALRSATELTLPGGQPLFTNGFIVAGEPILGRKLVIEPPRYNLAAMIPEGFRAISIAVTLETGVAGVVLPGDRVDITAFVPNPGSTGPDAFRAEPLLSGVRVLAIDQVFNDTVEGAKPSNTVTIEVTPEQARLVSAAARESRLGLALIGEDEAEKLKDDAPKPVPTLAELTKPKPAAVKSRPPKLERPSPPAIPKTVNVEVIHGTMTEKVETANAEAGGQS